jgi:hypothetical protein
MKQEFDELLCKQYPKIFRDRHAPMTETCMCWGFDIGNGWYNIINALCANIQHHIDWSRRQRLHALRYNRALKRAFDGNEVELLSYFTFDRNARQSKNWSEYAHRSVREELARGIPHYRKVPEACPQVIATQVKEKFGTLRFYYYGGDDYIRGLESMAASMSAVTCEECGNPGRLLTQGWHRTLCETHAKEQNYDWNIEEEDEDQISE